MKVLNLKRFMALTNSVALVSAGLVAVPTAGYAGHGSLTDDNLTATEIQKQLKL